MTLSCGLGPAIYVTSWTRDDVVPTEGSETVLDDTLTAQYTHTLTVTTAGEYTCTVANAKPSEASASLIVVDAVPSNENTILFCVCMSLLPF